LRKILVLLFLAFILSGCATYKFQKSTSGAPGYFVAYDGEPVLEYTIGKEKTLPDLALAKERFKRRRPTVEYYCKKTGKIESRFKEYLWDTPTMFLDFIGSVLRWPFIAVADYKYNHNPKYKARADKLDEEKEAMEKARINGLKEKLTAFIAEDLAKELPSVQGAVVVTPSVPKPQPVQEALPQAPALPAAAPAVVVPLAETKPPAVKAPVIKKALEPPVAVITAKPLKGYSPLTVKFSGQKSSSKNGKIVVYLWDFGDGDISDKKNPENTYYSTTYGIRDFTVTLTVKDAAGLTSSSTSIVEVSTP
jgi:hypothetical protein